MSLGLIPLAGDSARAFDSSPQACSGPPGAQLFSCACVVPQGSTQASAASDVAGSPPSAIGQKRILLYRVDFSDAVGAAISSNTAAALISDLNNFYRDMSYGLMSFALAEVGSVITETLRLPQPSTAYDNSFTTFIAATRQAAIDAGYPVSEFNFDIVCTGTKPSLIFGAVAYVGGPGLWIGNNNFNVGVAGHELDPIILRMIPDQA